MQKRLSERAGRLLPWLVLFALGLFVFRGLALTDRILGRGDTFVYFYPYWAARDAALRLGEIPLWTPDLFMGAPLLANPQLGTLYPPNWLTVMLDPPNAVRLSILLHVAWAAWGAYLLARRGVKLRRAAAVVTAALYGFGGYVGAHAEQINQLQGLAWLPWLFLLWHTLLNRPGRPHLGTVILLGAALALQFLAGHTQTVFVGAVGLMLYTVAAGRPRHLLTLAATGGVALLLAAPQLIPTLELIGVGGRDGGLTPNAALSFSLNPFIAARGLLPSYDGKLYSEYIAYIGVSGLFLAILGAWQPPHTPDAFPHRRAWVMIAAAALLLAVGAYNPLNWLIVRVPGFDLFRVPARWLALYGLAGAVLAGLGVERLLAGARRLWVPAAVLIGLFGLSFLAARVPGEVNGPAAPTWVSLVAWVVALGAVWAAAEMLRGQARQAALVAITLVELAAASLVMPYNDLVPPDVWRSQRLTISQMLAYTETDERGLTADGTPPGRLLSISGLFFDPGDQTALSQRYQALGMTPLEARYSFVAAKLKETLSPNLPLAWGVPSVDGFGGGLLPTRAYTEYMAAVYPAGIEAPVDGRLRENLAREACRGACLPGEAALDALDVRYLLVDKVYDVWHEGVAFDTTFPQTGEALRYTTPVPYEATEVQVLYTCPEATPGCQPNRVTLTQPGGMTATAEAGSTGWRVTTLADGLMLVTVALPAPYTVWETAEVNAANATLLAASLADDRLNNQFVQLVPSGWVRVLSSDIKLYRRTADGARVIVCQGGAECAPPSRLDGAAVTFRAYHPTRIELDVNAPDTNGLTLALNDSYYPGWRATVNGEPTPVYRTNVNFRAVSLQTGESRVIFEYDPWWFPGVLWLGGLLWGCVGITCISSLWRRYGDRRR